MTPTRIAAIGTLAAALALQPAASPRAADAASSRAPAKAAPAAPPGKPALDSPYAPFAGEPFFLLSDATFGSGDVARVRLEINSPQSLEQTGGVDIAVYRVPEPLAFLQKQKNLHRVQVEGRPAEEALGNTLTHLWDNWVVKSRLAWQRIFSAQARESVVAQAPGLKTPKALTNPSTFEEPVQYRPIAGLNLIERFRYPVQIANPIQPPKDLALAGSSSEFIKPSEGNVFVPLGKRAPGLYVVEAAAGKQRATTLLFVSDTVALTKVSGEQMLVWAAQRGSGAPVPKTRVVWTDGVGVLKSGAADDAGLARLDRKSPEQTYVFGEDPKGGVFVSENFYYDSEVYAAKVYAVTDRPLYRPGDAVFVKVTGREFKSARESVLLKDADMKLDVLDPAGQLVHTQTFRFSGAQGGDTRFALPDNAAAGGYEMRLGMGDDVYTAAFRVADYQKPHFEIALVADKADFKTGEAIAGRLQLNYPDGKPVASARVSLTARAQKLTMIEGELDYAGQAPLRLSQDELLTDSAGVAKFSLPPAAEPSRYVLTALATDGAAYRVRTSKELLVERSSGAFRVSADRQFSRPGEAVSFSVKASQRATTSATAGTAAAAGNPAAPELQRPAQWDWVRLENRARESGAMPGGDALKVAFPQPGSYTLTLRDEKGRIVGATSHFVSGDGAKAPAGSIAMVFDRVRYRAGETAEVLLSFPEPVEHALVTLERDKVEKTSLLAGASGWLRSERIAPTQWKLTLPVSEEMSPNMTLSVAYVKNGDYVFQNQGVLVEQPKIALAFRTDKALYAPGETVTVDVTTQLGGKPVPAEVAVGVVDEMIYVLQPEIAPGIDDFFYHPRRDNVRTSASLAFIGYDLATSKLGALPRARQVNERAVKVLERPRRDNIDTAAWQPRLTTDAQGRARFSFKMPDSLTRWRITGRAMEAGGAVGQQVSWLRSDKPFYAKWASPDWQREGDTAQAAVALFNQTGAPAKVEWEASGAAAAKATIDVQPGANFVVLPLTAAVSAASAPSSPTLPPGRILLTLRQNGKVVDSLETPLRKIPVAWRAPRERMLDMATGRADLALPADATRVRVSFAQDAAAGEFNRWLEDLIDFPYGCVEQTASRMLPLSIALQSLSPAQQPVAPMLTQRLSTARLALAQMAGPKARFGWWGRGMADDAFLTSYAYYADWRATQALRTTLPDDHWKRLLDVYATEGRALTPLQRALALSWMKEMGLPVRPMLAALVEELVAKPATDEAALQRHRGSFAMVDGAAVDMRDVALVLAVHTAEAGASAEHKAAADAAASRLAKVDAPLVQSLLIVTRRADASKAAAVLTTVRADVPTFDRAQSLIWLQQALGRKPDAGAGLPELPAPWQRKVGSAGQVMWELPQGTALPVSLALPVNGKAAFAFVAYESAEAQPPALPARVERTLWRVVTESKPVVAKEAAASEAEGASGARAAAPVPDPNAGRLTVKLEKVAPGTALDSNALYLDEVTVTAASKMRWAVVDVALPPGAAVEASTWGIDLGAGKEPQPLERARHQDTAQGYAVPFEALPAGAAVSVRHLVRFSQRGQFKLPPTRLHRMYEPEAKAFDGSGRWAQVEVR